MTYITDLADLIRSQAATSEIVAVINLYLDEKYAEDMTNRPTAQEWATAHGSQIIQWLILEHVHQIVEAFLMIRSSDPVVQAEGNNRILNYVTIYEDLRQKLNL